MNRLAAPPLRVSLLTTNAWMFGSTAVGPYTSWIGTMSYSKLGLNEVRKDRTRSSRCVNDSRTCLLALFTSKFSSKVRQYQREMSLRMRKPTCNSNDNLLPSDPCCHAQQNLMARMEMVKSPSQCDNGEGRFGLVRVGWEGNVRRAPGRGFRDVNGVGGFRSPP